MKLHINKITSVILIFILCIGGLNVFADIDTEDITLVISQVYVTNNGSYNQRFIELYNNSKNDIALSKYTLQYAASSANTCTSKLTFSQDDVIKAKSFFLVACGAVSKNGAALEPDAYWPQALSPNAKVAICTSSELQALPELSALPSGNIIEYVPWGSGTPQLGTALTNLSSTLAGFREHYSFNTGADFILKTPTPRNSKTVGQTVTLTPPEKITSLDIVSQTIDNNMVDVSLDDIISFTFNQNIKEGSGSFHITPECGGWANLSGKMLKIQHNNFEYGTTYTLTATEGFLTNEDGSQLSNPFSLTFTTEEKQKNIITAKNAKIGDDKLDFSGKITFVDGTQRIYVEDTTGGICLDLTPYNVTDLEQNVNPGDILTVKNGVRNVYYGMATVKFDNAPLSISVEKQAEDLTNVTYVTIAQANNMECRLVQIKNITVGDFDEAKSFTTLTDATGSINAYSADALLAPFRGRQINLVAAVGSYNGIMQLRLRSAADVVLGGDDTLPPVITYSDTINNANIHSDYKCDFQVSDERRLLNVAAFYKIDDNSFQPIALSNKNDNYYFVISKEELSAGSNLTFYITAFDGTNTTTAPEKTVAIEKTTLITSVYPPENTTIQDTNPNISVNYSGSVSNAKLYVNDIEQAPAITASSLQIKIPLSFGQHTVKVILDDVEYKWSFTISVEQMNIYFGQLHAHTNMSDGTGTVDEAYSWARDNAKLDFFSLTDHSNSFDNDQANENLTDYMQSTSTKWKTLNSICDSYNEDGSSVALNGFEMTWSGSTGGWGHINTFNTPWFSSRNNSKMDLQAYYQKLSQNTQSISQLNHPGKVFGDFAGFSFRTDEVDAVVNLIEVGNGEGQIRGSGYFPSYEYYNMALDKGWHVAPANNQDNHKKHWGNSNTARTVVLAPEKTRDSLYDALRNRRTYATEDNNIQVMYKVNGEYMGTILDSPEQLNLSIKVTDDEPIGKISIIANGGTIVTSKKFPENTAEWELTLPPEFSYYYVRIDQEDKDIVVTAPVWTGLNLAMGISAVTPSEIIAKTGQNLYVTVGLFNNTNVAVKNAKAVLYDGNEQIGSVVIPSLDVNGTVNAMIPYIPKVAGIRTLRAEVSMNVGGNERVFLQNGSIIVETPQDLVTAVIDVGHENAYVSGYYAGKYINFKDMLAQKGIALREEKVINKQALEGAAMLIITGPAKANDNTAYSDEELEAIKEFADSKKTIIVTAIADYTEKASYSTSAQANKILEKIDSSLRLNDDEACDDEYNGGQNFRLYFENYEFDLFPEYMKNFSKSLEDQTKYLPYSAYSGCTVAFKPTGNSVRLGALVRGYESSYSIDSDNDRKTPVVSMGLNADGKPNLVTLAAEELQSGTKVITGGTTFFSDFEVDGTSREIYNNYVLVNNIIDTVKPVDTYTKVTIGELRANREKYMGKKVIVEGVTTTESVQYGTENGRKNSFFDVIYVQSETGGICVFGVSSASYPTGMKLSVKGTVGEYEGDFQIAVKNEFTDIDILDSKVKLTQPKTMTTGQSMEISNEGWLVKTTGIVKKITDTALFIDDGSGEAKIFVNGYVGSNPPKDELFGCWDKEIEIGDYVSAIGIASEDAEGHRLRVRNTAEIQLLGKKEQMDKIEVKPTVSAESISKGGAGGGGTGTDEIIGIAENINAQTVEKNSFDDTANHWAKLYIDKLFERGIINGYENGRFEPDNAVTRAEFALMLMKAEVLSEKAVQTMDLTDVLPGDWYYEAACFTVDNGLILGYDDKTFLPNNKITREETAVVISRLLREFLPEKESDAYFNDHNQISDWARESIYFCIPWGVLSGYENSTYRPKGNLTRAEACTILSKVLDLIR